MNFLSTYSDKKSCNTSTTLQTGIARLSAIAELLVMYYVPIRRLKHPKDATAVTSADNTQRQGVVCAFMFAGYRGAAMIPTWEIVLITADLDCLGN